MNKITLHYIYDPYCGWCYAAAPLIEVAANHPNIDIELHGGGMLAGNSRLHLDDQFRQYILQSDKRIAAMTGQVFGDDYIKMLHEPSLVMDSTPPQTAILAAAKQGKAIEMLKAIQKAHYISGHHINEPHVLSAIANELGLDSNKYQQDYVLCEKNETDSHIQNSKKLLAQSGSSGFPTLLIKQQDKWLKVPLQNYLGDANKWQQFLDSLIAAAN
ncbi:DsbA family protein [Providencia heimbachae]|uniref:Thioredoxin-like protein n=1 Tax=Providencia heimbachae ATCC 35613 TaxID=1354272 RepID=A0A1B7JPI0_9GAMM|nr:DsbA family protein [Providencia heimbachae]OAT49800.1 thioredoxin-like protein [Providencia heimbachae ATCC 35613]SQH12191.1 DSBA-like thioredoxin domain [Providencia heimbachae]